MQTLSSPLRMRFAGLLLMVLGAFALSAPLGVGGWSLSILGIPLIVLSVMEAYAAFTSERRGTVSAYLPSVLAMFAGNLLLLRSALVVSGLLVLLFVILVFDGLAKILTVWRKPATERVPVVINALVDFGCAILLWSLTRVIAADKAVGIAIGVYIAAAGWRMIIAPAEAATAAASADGLNVNPDPGLASHQIRPSRACAPRPPTPRRQCAPPI